MEDFETQFAVMHDRFPAASMSYLDTTWLVYKERFVTAFLRNKHHYGNVTTSRVESAHASLKEWNSVLTGIFSSCYDFFLEIMIHSFIAGDLLSVDSAVSLAFEGQLAVVVQQNAKQRSIVNMQLGTMFAEVMGKISVEIEAALKRIADDYNDAANHRKHVAGQRGQRSEFHRSLNMLLLLWVLRCNADDAGYARRQATVPEPVVKQQQHHQNRKHWHP
uniref:AlNc14C51G4022 protein n=1 Tax=Albugo laibachii Nc14 TaxID=890382 RepID=F0WBH5_9STRA|nr:AlNc14C51G4022 [Albugo laibachii Nc14]|eukprot:CCA18501.1 AlNc14C51G4022 [Albugo laibachii Nc14]